MPPNEPARAILLVGSVGSGKTTVLLEVGRILRSRRVAYALVDLDWLAWAEPAASAELGVHDILAANLEAACATFRRAGIYRLVLARHVTLNEELEAIERALGEAEVAVVRLEAPSALLEARLRARDSGAELEDHLTEVAHLSIPEFPYVEVANDGRGADEVAADVLRGAGW